MSEIRILQIDDDPLMRKIVASALSAEPTFTVASCEDGEKGLAQAADWQPHLILCDVVMPGLSGQQVLSRLRENPATQDIPVIFTTAQASASDIASLTALGAAAVIAKPFKLRELAETLCRYLRLPEIAADAIPLTPVEYDFSERLRSDAAELKTFRRHLADDPDSPEASDNLRRCVHKLAGAAGIYEFQAVSDAASSVEDAIHARKSGNGPPEIIERALDELLACMARES